MTGWRPIIGSKVDHQGEHHGNETQPISGFSRQLAAGDGVTNYSVSLSGDDDAELRGYWEKLSEGGTTLEPLVEAPWGDSFGMCIDKFGVKWLVNIAGDSAE